MLDGTGAGSVLTVTVSGGNTTTIGQIIDKSVDDHGLSAINGSPVDLTGSILISEKVKTIRLHNAGANTLIDIGAALNPVACNDAITIGLNSACGLSVEAHDLPIASLTATNWTVGFGASSEITAAWIGSLRITGNGKDLVGDFQSDIDLSGLGLQNNKPALNTAFIHGDLFCSTWTLPARAVSITILGDMINSRILITHTPGCGLDAISSLTIGGQVFCSEIRSVGDLGKITVGAMDHSRIFAGVDDTVGRLPDPSCDIYLPDSGRGQACEIRSITIRGMANQGLYYSFASSSIAAYRIDHAVLSYADFTSDGNPFGISAWSAGSIRYIDRDRSNNWTWSGRANQLVNSQGNMTMCLGISDLNSFAGGERVGTSPCGNTASLHTDLRSVYMRTIGDDVYIGITAARPLYSHLRIAVLLDTLDGTDHQLYANDKRSDMLVDLDTDSNDLSLYEGDWPVVDPWPAPSWSDLWHPARWLNLPTMTSQAIQYDDGYILRVPKLALQPFDHIKITAVQLWTDDGILLDTVRC